ncbi:MULTISPECIES: GlcG/HbpS family heme-binding protein [Comamonas]|uniref:GlcG/HbpS family heme-binding protein n=1 Tax=Comamonas TaxID=283 RepID=UPI001CC0A4ED|nr:MULTISPECIES: heme-binding protein [Comamonas]
MLDDNVLPDGSGLRRLNGQTLLEPAAQLQRPPPPAAGPADRGALQRRRLQRQRLGVGRFGVLLAMVRADGAGPHTAEASHAKTFTSASSRNPTSGIAKAIQSNPDAAGMANIPGFLVLGGGVPLKIGNETLVPLVPLAWPVRLAAIWTKPALIRPSPR